VNHTEDVTAMTRAYEDLRLQVATGSPAPVTPQGLAIFMRGGTPAWIAAWRSLGPRRPDIEPSIYATVLPSTSALAAVLAEMAVQRWRATDAR